MARKVKVNMEGVESFTRCPEGEWLARLKKIDVVELQGSGDDGLKAQFEVIKGSAKGNSVFETFSLAEKALWKLKSFLEAAGMKSNGKLTLDLDKMEGKICIIDVIHDEYNGQKRAKIASYIKPGDEEEADDDDLDEDIEDEEEEAPKKSKKAAAKKPKKAEEPEDDDDDEDDEEEEEDEKPAKKSKGGKKPSKKAPAKKAKKPEPEEDDEDDDDDDDWEEDDD